MTSAQTRRELLERVRRGELSAAAAAAALRGTPVSAGGEVTFFAPCWTRAEPLPARAGDRAGLLVVLDVDAEQVPGATVCAVRGSDFREAGGVFEVGVDDDASWSRLWTELSARGLLPERIVLVSSATSERSLDTVCPLVRTIIRDRVGGDRVDIACVVPGDRSGATAAALGGFCQVAALEDRRLRMLAISAPELLGDPAACVDLALAELDAPAPGLAETRHDRGGRWVRDLRPATPEGELYRLRQEGVYLVSGGAGGLGLRVAELLAMRTRARIVLFGRSPHPHGVERARGRIESAGGEVGYVQADVTDPGHVAAVVDVARTSFGPINGVLHLAGVNEDAYLVNKREGAHRGVLDPKLIGVRNLDESTQDDPLDLFVVFSSVVAYLGAPGQTDYAAAGRALGGFATHRADEVAAGRRRGTTVAVGWPLWADGGMTLADEDARAVELLQGITAMPAEVGFDAMLTALAMRIPEVLVAHGNGALTRKYVSKRTAVRPLPGRTVAADGAGLRTAVERYLVALVAETTRIPAEQLGVSQEFSALGVDSVLIRRLGAELEKRAGALPATLLFEHRTVGELATYLIDDRADTMRQALEVSVDEPEPEPEPEPVPAPQVRLRSDHPVPTAPGDGIAIIGIAGRYPGADNLDELWAMLAEGRDAIVEVPGDRWDNNRFYDPATRRPGSTYGRWGGFLRDVRRFDSLFFAIAPREARRMDPAERLFMEVSWSAIEDAGYTRGRLHRVSAAGDSHAIGVYVGATGLGYQLIGAEEWGKGNPVSAHSMDFSLANRLSYFLDAHGPSIVVDTACSASLTALHLACEALRAGDCRVAIAGGAYLNLHPSKFAMLSEQRMISADGVVRAFGDGANGFVPGEGVGAVVLKPLSAAVADDDHVHAVIRGTAIAHGGRTNGYTVPSPRGHAAVIRGALDRAGVPARSVGYVEAHGTGTELGDPVEFDGLSRVFDDSTDGSGDRQFCALGSVKPNIGHAESAAGIAGLTKIVLQLRHGMLAPTLHSDPPNPRIDFETSPFRLQRTLAPWPSGTGGNPRRAAVSSFGAGGANAHVVVEEHTRADRAPEPTGIEHLIVLSARTPDRLDAMVDRLVAGLTRSTASLRAVAYTLQVGREPLEHRLAVSASSLDDLRDRLARRGDPDTGLRTGHVEPGRTPALTAGEVARLFATRNWRELGDLWLAGADIDWAAAYEVDRPTTVPLPTYPFAGPEHWPAVSPATADAGDVPVSLDPADPVVADHVVAGRRVLAGVAHLELMRSAAQSRGTVVTALTDVRWRSPYDPTTDAVVRLSDVHGQVVAEVASDTVVHSSAAVHIGPAGKPAAVDVAGLRARCPDRTDGEDLYAGTGDLALGPTYRRVRTLWCGTGEALAVLDGSPPRHDGWWLEPGLTDAALHAVHGALPPSSDVFTVPVSVARVDLWHSSAAVRYSHATLVSLGDDEARFDVVLYDPDGVALVAFTGLRVRRRATGVPYFRPTWRVRPATPTAPVREPVLVLTSGHDRGLGEALARHHSGETRVVPVERVTELTDVPVPSTVYFLGGVDTRHYGCGDLDHLEACQNSGVVALFQVAQLLAAQRARGVRLVVVTNDTQQTDELVAPRNPFASSIPGLTRVISRELSFLDVVCADVSAADLDHCAENGEWTDLVGALAGESATEPMTEVALRAGVRLEKVLVPAVLPAPDSDRVPLRRGGRYLVVGGAGGLGRAVGGHLAREYGARLVITGRRAVDDLDPDLLPGLRAEGGEVEYVRADVTDADAMRSVVAHMRNRYGGIDGVIHTAFVLADRTIGQMDMTTFRTALDAKVRGTVVLADAVAAEQLDFVALFSSAIAHTGNPGQANYAAGSTFQDTFGTFLAAWSHQPVHVIDWGFWGDRGAVATDEYHERLTKAGVAPISDAEGIEAFRRVLGNGIRQATPLRAGGSLAAATRCELELAHHAEPVPMSVVEQVHHAVRAAVDAAGEPYEPGYLDDVDVYTRMLITGVPAADGLEVREDHRPLYDALVTAAADGAATVPTTGDLSSVRAMLRQRYPHVTPTLDLLDDCVAALPEVLSGAREGLAVLFPGGSDERMAALYRDDPRVRYFNSLSAAAAAAAVDARLGITDALRVLEIGAGTGGTSGPALDAIARHGGRFRYDYTDISPVLVGNARARFGRRGVEFRVLDIAGDLAAQGFAADRYDVVIATNVLHATADVRATLRNVAALMAPGAVLVMNEATRVLDSVTLMFGLTDGWWLAADPEHRLPGSPLLAPGRWEALLVEAGLRGVRRHGVASWADHESGQHLFVAERDGWRRTPVVAQVVRSPRQEAVAEPVDTGTGLRERTIRYLGELCAELLRAPVDEIEPSTPLASLGVDSLITMELRERLEQVLGAVPAEVPRLSTVAEMADALLTGHGTALAAHLGDQQENVVTPEVPASPVDEAIAIVGVAGRYPGARDLDEFWANLLAGRSAISQDRPAREPGTNGYHRWGAYLDDADLFDPLLFRISPAEAERMDPTERVFLQTAWEALEDAGWPPSRLRAVSGERVPVGVFVGVMHAQYELGGLSADAGQPQRRSARWSVANRVSHSLGLSGPSLAVDTACSSAFTALHLAAASLRRGECTAALAGGVNLVLHPWHDTTLAGARMLSPNGDVRVFADDADGMVTGEGTGAVVLKRLSDAVRDGDRIHATILATALNADGGAQTYAVPDQSAQEHLIRAALSAANIDPASIDYVEAHATGSPVGDPVELAALARVLGRPAAGSVKPNIGHLEGASGMAQLTKVLLQLRHDTLAPTLGSTDPDGADVVREPRAWPTRNVPRRAAISSFGAGGANTHVIVQEAPRPSASVSPSDEPAVIVLSARRQDRLVEQAARLRDFLRGPGTALPIADVAHTLRVGREPLRHRVGWQVRDVAEAVARLDAYVSDPAAPIPAGPLAAWLAGGPTDFTTDDATGRIVSLPHYPFARERHWLAPRADEPAPRHEELTEQMPTTDDRTGLDAEVIATIADVIGVRPGLVEDDDRLSDLGFDSVSMVTLAGRLSDLTRTEINPAVLYGHRDVAALIADLSASAHETPVPPEPHTAPPEEAAPPPRLGATPVATPPAPPRAPGAVAVIGMAGAFPGSPDLAAYWQNLVSGRDLIEEVRTERLAGKDSTNAKWCGFLRDVDLFDAEFFRISPREARLMDPHHRLFLQTVWAAIEEAGYDPGRLAGSACGVFVGVASSEYAQLARAGGVDVDGQFATGNDHSMVANRVSFLLDLHGPSEPVDTACSSSLVAIDKAVRAIQSGDCDLAVAGGVNVILTPDAFDAFGGSGMLAPDGRCKAFDHRADGYVRGEGVGALLLKPLDRALADGDHIHAVVTGTATNHGGRSNSLTAPNPAAQAAVITKAHRRAGIAADTVGYVEAHGTGTSLGDPIEITGLRTAFGDPAPGDAQYCGIGSVKTNVGHLETAAGIAGVLKVILALKARLLPPTLHVERVNPLVELDGTAFRLVTAAQPWQPRQDGAGRVLPRRAGASSFGYGGTNAHVLLEEAPPVERTHVTAGGPHLFVLSALDGERLREYARLLAEHLAGAVTAGTAPTAADVAHTLWTGRPRLAARLAVVADTVPELVAALRIHIDGGTTESLVVPAAAGTSATEIEPLVTLALGGSPRPLAQAWVDGHDADRAIVGPAGHRVSLPTYPFARTRHWLPEPARPTAYAPNEPPAPAPARVMPPPAEPTPSVRRTVPAARGSFGGAAQHLLRHVQEAVAEGIGITVDDVDPARDFAAYGVDSIGALRIMQHIQSRYGDHIPMAAILEHPSVDQLVEHLRENYVLPDTPPGTVDEPSHPAQVESPPRLVPFADGTGNVPAYCVFGDTGELTWLLHLREVLGKQGPVFGLEAPGFADDAPPSGDIEELADRCAEVIAVNHDGGLCRIVGHGTAGFVAAEAARTLMRRGVEVAELLLVDTPEPALDPVSETVAASTAAVANVFASAWGATEPVPPTSSDDLERCVDDTAARLGGLSPLPPGPLRQRLRAAVGWRVALVAAATGYRAQPITGAGAVTVIRTVGSPDAPRSGDYDRWIAPPPIVHELGRPSWGGSSAAAADEIAGVLARSPGPTKPPRSSLVAINRFGSSSSSVWAHNLYGEVSYAIYLSRHLGMGRPVMGLEQIDAGARVQEYGSVEEMSARYADELRERHSGEPFILGGCSFGGVLAYDIARQLQLAGERVTRLIAIDPIMPGTESWDSVDWGQVSEMEAESFSIVMLGNASCQRWGVAERLTLQDLADRDIDEQLDVVARHIIDRSPAKPAPAAIRRQIRIRHDLMMRNNVLLQEYRPSPLVEPIPTTLFHATQGFLAAENDNDLPPIPRTSADRSNGFAEFVGGPLVIHELDADHFTIAYDHNLVRIARLVAPLLDGAAAPAGLNVR